MKIPFDKQWLVMEREDYANYLFVSVTWESFTNRTKEFGFVPGKFYGAEYIDSACNLFVLKEPYDESNKIHFQMLFTKPWAWDRLHLLTLKYADELFEFGKKVRRLESKKLSDKQLVGWIERFQKAQAMVHVPRGPMFLLETPDNQVTNYLLGYLKDKAKDAQKTSIQPYEAFHVLTTPLKKSLWAKEKEDLAEIAAMKNGASQEKQLVLHAKKYEWLEYGLQGKILSLEYFRQELKKLQKKIGSKRHKSFKQEAKEIGRRQIQATREYHVHPSHKKIFKIVQDSFHTRLYSKDSQFFGY